MRQTESAHRKQPLHTAQLTWCPDLFPDTIRDRGVLLHDQQPQHQAVRWAEQLHKALLEQRIPCGGQEHRALLGGIRAPGAGAFAGAGCHAGEEHPRQERIPHVFPEPTHGAYSLSRAGMAGALPQPRNYQPDHRAFRRPWSGLAEIKPRTDNTNMYVPLEKPWLQHDSVHGSPGRYPQGHLGGGRAGRRRKDLSVLPYQAQIPVAHDRLRADPFHDQLIQDLP